MSSTLSVAPSAPTQVALHPPSASPPSGPATASGKQSRLMVVYAEPVLRPDLGLVIIEFRTSTGMTVDSIPTAQALERYQRSLLLNIGGTDQGLAALTLSVADRARAGPDSTRASIAQQQGAKESAPSTVAES